MSEQEERVMVDYRKTLDKLSKEELIQIIFDFLKKGGYISRTVHP